MKKNYLFTSESVTEGHPDKVCDMVSDGILDAILFQDKDARVSCETMITKGMVVVSAEITSTAKVDYESIIRKIENSSFSLKLSSPCNMFSKIIFSPI